VRRFTSRLLVVCLLAAVLSASAAMAADTNGTSDPTWDQYVSWTTSSADTGLSFDDWVILMGRMGIPIG
jgi:hypothetical protein